MSFWKVLVIRMLQFKKLINGVNFDVSFIDSINVIRGSSGTGKTFLFNVISAYCAKNNITHAYIDYKTVLTGDTDLILPHCKGKDIVILDNADLYLTSDLFQSIRDLGCTIILSKKTTFGLNMRGAHLYTIDYKGNVLATRRLC